MPSSSASGEKEALGAGEAVAQQADPRDAAAARADLAIGCHTSHVRKVAMRVHLHLVERKADTSLYTDSDASMPGR